MSNKLRDKYKRYTKGELDKLFPNWKKDLNSDKECLLSIKPVISSFNEFDDNTKKIYLKIAEYLKKENPSQPNLKLWATGSRVNGRWRTAEEAEKWAIVTNTEIRYSDYDYITNAKNIPTYEDMCKYVKVNVENVKYKYRDLFVEIPL